MPTVATLRLGPNTSHVSRSFLNQWLSLQSTKANTITLQNQYSRVMDGEIGLGSTEQKKQQSRRLQSNCFLICLYKMEKELKEELASQVKMSETFNNLRLCRILSCTMSEEVKWKLRIFSQV